LEIKVKPALGGVVATVAGGELIHSEPSVRPVSPAKTKTKSPAKPKKKK
jgi:hypothetical protein